MDSQYLSELLVTFIGICLLIILSILGIWHVYHCMMPRRNEPIRRSQMPGPFWPPDFHHE